MRKNNANYRSRRRDSILVYFVLLAGVSFLYKPYINLFQSGISIYRIIITMKVSIVVIVS